jgi:hypothetical protein
MATFADIDVAGIDDHLAAMGSQCVKRLFEIGFHRLSIGWSNVENYIASYCHPHQSRSSCQPTLGLLCSFKFQVRLEIAAFWVMDGRCDYLEASGGDIRDSRSARDAVPLWKGALLNVAGPTGSTAPVPDLADLSPLISSKMKVPLGVKTAIPCGLFPIVFRL